MREYLIKFWTKDNQYSGARIFAISSAQAIEIAKSTYNAVNIVSWDEVK